MIKYKISYIKKNKYVVLEYIEDGDSLEINRTYTGNINECEEFIKDKRSETKVIK